jgi:hypothetical protein
MEGSAIPERLGRPSLPSVAVIVTTILFLAGCSGSGSGGGLNAGGSANSSSAVGYSVCVRSRGVPNFPDPDSNGQLPKPDAHHLGVSSSQLQEAQRACQHLLPNTGGAINADSIQQCMMADDCPQSVVQQVRTEELGFARCMRSHGVPNWPDPIIDPQGRPVFAISISKDGFDPYSSQIWAKGNECSHLMPGLPGLPAAVSP